MKLMCKQCNCFFCLVFVIVCLYAMAEANPKPYLRSNLARTVYDKMMVDERLRTMDLSKMYEVDELALEDDVRKCFLQLSKDEDTQKFIDGCFEQSEWLITQVWHAVAKSFLGFFMTQTSVNGLLGRGRMFVWSQDQAKQLLSPVRENSDDPQMRWKQKYDETNVPLADRDEILQGSFENFREEGSRPEGERVHIDSENAREDDRHSEALIDTDFLWVGERLLDLGAGDGHVTQILAAGVKHVDVTEASPVMRRRLQSLGYRVLNTWHWMDECDDQHYDVITALNLLDRCDTPRTLLKDIHQKLADNGLLVVALVLPFAPYVETGSADNLPSETLGITGSTIEEQVNCLATEVFPSLGFHLKKWSKLPYLCEGDLDQAYYWLSDVVLVLEKENNTLDREYVRKYASNINEKVEL